MRRDLGYALGILLILATPVANAAEWLVLENLKLIDGTGSEPRTVSSLLVRDGVIASIDGEPSVSDPKPMDKVTRIDLDGAWVMPGLVDAHVHLAHYPRGHNQLADRLDWAVRGGVTTVRDMGGDARVLAEARRALEAGELVGPTVRFSAILGGESMFDHPVLAQAARGYGPGNAPWLRAISDDTDLTRMMAKARGAGVSGVKIYGDLDAAQLRRVAEAAEAQGLMRWAHGTVFPARPSELVAAGVQSLSHAPYLVWEAVDSVPADYRKRTQGPYSDIPPDHPRILALLERMAEEGVVLDTTLSLYRDMHRYRPPEGIEWASEAFDWGVELVRLAHEHGVMVAAGTDAFEPVNSMAPPNTHVELFTLVEDVGMAPMEALVAATRNGAIATGVDQERGTLTVGKAADLLVLDANPLENIRNTLELRLVVTNGQIVQPGMPGLE
ncbi:imidazolonepropionase-like amidohydrolase [Natronospira proteinivora]|uniref:Imidazolonepropionase-like amidohydrolase n=1 Tax=Natronospira proteinivora TaxID=1807133 RepID=A0ABT1G5J3_9GAMM|nr:amidohydrolase family protein [Natronospira proteinivora]MCP1726574.1 imidazolonepropionase-like amidohydrolase [Natronospira proteinivora]